jgi:hypothetical protein
LACGVGEDGTEAIIAEEVNMLVVGVGLGVMCGVIAAEVEVEAVVLAVFIFIIKALVVLACVGVEGCDEVRVCEEVFGDEVDLAVLFTLDARNLSLRRCDERRFRLVVTEECSTISKHWCRMSSNEKSKCGIIRNFSPILRARE